MRGRNVELAVLAPVGEELSDKSEKQVERLLVPILAGAFRGTSSADRRGRTQNSSSNRLTRWLLGDKLKQALELVLAANREEGLT